jgi:DNA-binding GntR family transcriptional regulator
MLNTNVVTKSKTHQIYDRIKHRILTQQVKQGQRISERELAKEFGVARGTMRESILRLRSEGFVENIPGIGACVKDYSIDEIKEQLYIRGIIEGGAAAAAAAVINNDKAKRLRKLIEELEVAFDEDKFEKLWRVEIAIHRTIADICENETLKSMIYNSLGLRLMMTPGLIPMSREAVDEHKAILASIIECDSKSAEKLMRQHIADGSHMYIKRLQQENNHTMISELFNDSENV